MAGGPNAEFVVCYQCGSKAERTYEGRETDKYQCSEGHEFGVDWSRGELPNQPQWPPPPELLAHIKATRAK